MWNTIRILLLTSLLVLPATSLAQVEVHRGGDENPVLTVSKSILYGGLAGLVLGGALALAVEENEGEVVRWFFVGGTFVGLGAGIYHVNHRAKPSAALFQVSPDGMHAALPTVEAFGTYGGGRGVRVSLLSFSE